MSAQNSPPEIPPPPPPPSGQWAFPTDERGEPKKKYVLWIVFGAAGCFGAVVVLGLLATLLVPRLVRSISHAQQVKAQSEIDFLCIALESHAARHGGRYPDTLEALENLEVPRDPWGRAFHYDPPTADRAWPDVYSLGRDGLPGGDGEDADVHPLRAAAGKR